MDPIIARISGQTGRLIPVNTIPDEFRDPNSTVANVTEPVDAKVALPVEPTDPPAPVEETTKPVESEPEAPKDEPAVEPTGESLS